MTRLLVSGGGAQSSGAMQIAADVFNLPAVRPQVAEASALGAAMLAASALGWYGSVGEAARAMAHSGTSFAPVAANVATYDALYKQVYQPMYGRLRPLYARIRAITGYPG